MQKSNIIILLIALILIGCKQSAPTKIKNMTSVSSKFHIEILNDEALKIIDPNATIEVLANGFAWTEGPLWVENGQFLLFSDIPNNKVYKLKSKNDTASYLNPSGYLGKDFKGSEPGSNGLLLNNKGELILLQHGERQLAKMDAPLNAPKPTYKTIVDNYQGKKLNSPNDGSFDADGNLYFTDPPYGLPKRLDDSGKELDFQGVYCLFTTGELALLDKDITFPNGIAVSNDGKNLYVSVSDPKNVVWYKYNISAPGKVANKRLFYNATPFFNKDGYPGIADGLKVNKNGVVFATGPGGVWLFSPEGILLARIYTGERTSNCAFDTEEKKLFITADSYVLSVALK